MMASQKESADILHEAVQMSFGEMAFVDAIPQTDPDIPLDVHQILFLDFQEPVRGWIALLLPLDLKKRISENIYARSWEELSFEEIDDCLLELLNVLGGNYLNLYAGEDKKHNLSFPQVMFDMADLPGDGSEQSICYDGEGIPFIVRICIDQRKE